MKKLATLFLATYLHCAQAEDVVSSPTTFAICKAADIASTAYLLENHLAVEGNPLVAELLQSGYFPLIILSVGIWWFMKEHPEQKVANTAANVVTCVVAANNILLIP